MSDPVGGVPTPTEANDTKAAALLGSSQATSLAQHHFHNATPLAVGRFGICAENRAGRTPRELRVPISRPLLGPRSS
eukprot:12997781-Alexandrium_andersonii.AAC.1